MDNFQKKSALLVLLSIVILSSCKRDRGTPEFGNFPAPVAKIMMGKCAVPGCHTGQSKDANGGLSLVSWNDLFNGSTNGADVIPYRTDFSPLLFFVNTYPDLGISLKPTMPNNRPALSRDEVETLKNWITQGAPDENGFVKFSDNPNRRKIYVSNQGCDVVTVFDEVTGIPMRYISVGISPNIEAPHMIKISPDGKYWYVVFTSSNVVQRYNTSDDSFAGQVSINSGNWNTITFTHDSKYAFVVDWSANGQIAYLDLSSMSVISTWTGSQLFEYPHGSAINKTDDTLYVTGQTGNYIYKIPINDPTSAEQVSLQPGKPAVTSPSLDIHEISFSPDYSKYFVTCQGTNEVRVIKTSNDSLLKIIPVGIWPQEMSFSKTSNYMFVSCQEDTLTFPGKRGSIAVIDYNSNTLFKTVFSGFQPHGLTVDDTKNLVYVANRNVTSKGPAPHHTGYCGGRNGYVTFIDMTTMTLVTDLYNDKRTELSVDPYSVAIR